MDPRRRVSGLENPIEIGRQSRTNREIGSGNDRVVANGAFPPRDHATRKAIGKEGGGEVNDPRHRDIHECLLILRLTPIQVLVNGNHYMPCVYPVKTQTTKVLLPNKNIESYSKQLKPASVSDNTLTYGPYTDVQPLAHVSTTWVVFCVLWPD